MIQTLFRNVYSIEDRTSDTSINNSPKHPVKLRNHKSWIIIRYRLNKINYFVLNFLANLSLVNKNFYTSWESFKSYERQN
jgi:hypothetical protein